MALPLPRKDLLYFLDRFCINCTINGQVQNHAYNDTVSFEFTVQFWLC
jgi:hypothetical protein